MKQNNQLFLTLYRSIVAQFHKLTSRQMAIFLWSMVKADHNDKTIVMAIYKKLHKILKNNQKIKLYKEGQQLPLSDLSQTDINGQQLQIIHHMHEANFIHLIWAIQKTRIIDEKLILDLLKHTFQDKELKNLQKVRVQNLCLLAHCLEEMKFQKFRISQTIINQIVQSWQQLQGLSILTLVLLCQSFTNFVHYQQQYLNRYEKNFTSEEIQKKKLFISKQKRFIFLIVQTILLKQDNPSYYNKHFKKKLKKNQSSEDISELSRLINPLSSKFASQIIFNLGKLNLYEKKIWYKLLKNITDDTDQAESQDLSMTLTGICNLQTKEIPSQDMKSLIYEQKKIISRRSFQIYTSLSGKSLQKIKQLIYQRKIESQLVPSRIRKEVQQQFMTLKMKENQEKHHNQDRETQKQVKTNNTDQQIPEKHLNSERKRYVQTSSQRKGHKRALSSQPL